MKKKRKALRLYALALGEFGKQLHICNTDCYQGEQWRRLISGGFRGGPREPELPFYDQHLKKQNKTLVDLQKISICYVRWSWNSSKCVYPPPFPQSLGLPQGSPQTHGLFGLSINPGSANANRQFGEALQQDIGFFDDRATHFGIRSPSLSVFLSLCLCLFLPPSFPPPL